MQPSRLESRLVRGAWIETAHHALSAHAPPVAPLTGRVD